MNMDSVFFSSCDDCRLDARQLKIAGAEKALQPIDSTGGPARIRTWDQLIMSQLL